MLRWAREIGDSGDESDPVISDYNQPQEGIEHRKTPAIADGPDQLPFDLRGRAPQPYGVWSGPLAQHTGVLLSEL